MMPSMRNGHQRCCVSAARNVATMANTPSTRAYAPKRIPIATHVAPGHRYAKIPKITAAMPRTSHVHQLRVSEWSIGPLVTLPENIAVLHSNAFGEAGNQERSSHPFPLYFPMQKREKIPS